MLFSKTEQTTYGLIHEDDDVKVPPRITYTILYPWNVVLTHQVVVTTFVAGHIQNCVVRVYNCPHCGRYDHATKFFLFWSVTVIVMIRESGHILWSCIWVVIIEQWFFSIHAFFDMKSVIQFLVIVYRNFYELLLEVTSWPSWPRINHDNCDFTFVFYPFGRCSTVQISDLTIV
jgi:hypothetical protein